MRTPEEVARKVGRSFGLWLVEEAGLDAATDLIRARDAEVAEQVRAEVLAAATWEFRMDGRQQRFRLIGPWEPVEP